MRGAEKAARRAKEVRHEGAPPPSLGGQWCDFIEEYAVHGEGDMVGEPLKLHADFETMLWRAGELVPDAEGRWTNSWVETINVGPKDTGKSLTMAGIGFLDAFGPVELDGWDANGNPVGRARSSVRVVCVATEESQSRNVYGPLVHMLGAETCGDAFRRQFGAIDIGKGIYSSTRVILPDNRGMVVPMSAGAASKEGSKATAILVEELHLWVLKELVDLYFSLRRALIKRDWARLFVATNYFDPTEQSALQRVVESIQAGTSPRSLLVGNFLPPGILSDDMAVRDHPRKTIEKALKIVYGSAWGFVRRQAIIDYALDGANPDGDVRRYAFNQARTSKGKWMDAATWHGIRSSERLQPGDQIALGFDGGRRRDATALVACRLSDRLVQPLAIWEKPEAAKTWEVPGAQVERAVADAFATYRVARMYCDPPSWREEVAAWAREHTEDVVVEFPTYVDKPIAHGIARFEEAAVSGQVHHADDATLSRHVLNAETAPTKVWIEEGKRGVRLAKPHGVDEGSPRAMIDGAVAMLLAHEAAVDAIADGALDDDGPSIYEQQGVTWLD